MRPEPEEIIRPEVPAQLFAWLSPAFPVSGFAFSQGLETAVELGWVTDAESLTEWLSALTQFGSLRNELVQLSIARRTTTPSEVEYVKELSAALQPCGERAAEALTQGESFRQAYVAGWIPETSSCWAHSESPLSLAAAVGLAARDHTIDLATTLEAFAVAWHGNLLSAAIRLGVIGQFDGQRIQAKLMTDIRTVTGMARTATEDDLGSATYGADIASLLHETQTTRIFRS